MPLCARQYLLLKGFLVYSYQSLYSLKCVKEAVSHGDQHSLLHVQKFTVSAWYSIGLQAHACETWSFGICDALEIVKVVKNDSHLARGGNAE